MVTLFNVRTINIYVMKSCNQYKYLHSRVV